MAKEKKRILTKRRQFIKYNVLASNHRQSQDFINFIITYKQTINITMATKIVYANILAILYKNES